MKLTMLSTSCACVFSRLAIVAVAATLREAAVGKSAPAGWAHGDVTPISKVTEMLDVLNKQVEHEGVKDGYAFVEYTNWYDNETASARKIISDANTTILDLTASIEEADAFQTSEGARHTKVANALSKAQKELDDTTKERKKERAAFLENEGTLVEGIQSLTAGLEVLAKSAPAAKQDPAALVAVMKRLRTSLLQDHDMRMTDSQRHAFDSVLHSASLAARESQVASNALAPEFLQVRQQAQEPYGDYETQSGGAVSTLQSVLEKSQVELDKARKEEAEAATQFKSFEAATSEAIAGKEKTLSEIKTAIAHSQERESQMRGEVASEKELLKVSIEGLQETMSVYNSKRQAYKERMQDRSDERDALRKASYALTSDTANTILNVDKEAASFLQMAAASTTRRKALHILKRSTAPGLALLALEAHTTAYTTASQSTSDPFDKVKNMLFSMMTKLQAEQAKETDKHGWCTKEMGKSTVSLKSKAEKLQILTTRIDSIAAELDDLAEDITTVEKDLLAMRNALGSATKIRMQEAALALSQIKEYKEAQSLVETALKVLKKYYEERAARADATQTTKERKGMGGGVIALLEVAKADYAKLQTIAEESESTSAAQFKELQQESRVRIKTFETQSQYLNRNKVKLESDKVQYESDKKTYKEELAAVSDYLEKLKGECIAKAEPYEERKQRREAELASLKEALEFLNGDGMAPSLIQSDDVDNA